MRQGDWKLRWQYKPYGKGDWELFNVAKDPAERKDLAAQHPDKVKALLAVWDEYVKANNVILPSRGPFETLEDSPAAAGPGRVGFPAADLQASVRAAEGHAGRSEVKVASLASMPNNKKPRNSTEVR